jgi:hypothetical protein
MRSHHEFGFFDLASKPIPLCWDTKEGSPIREDEDNLNTIEDNLNTNEDDINKDR